uniref:Uncharacterized protein n=1 Tax=viral metagenome TaxID=1070528 RepID=A0A6C0ISF7_9ZZZZ
MYLIFIISFILINASYAVNTKYLVKNNVKKYNKPESNSCKIIKQRKALYLRQCAHSKSCKPLYIPESKNCL